MAGTGDATRAAVHDQTNLLSKRELLKVFPVLGIASMIAFIDQNGVGIALPEIGRDLNATATVSWAGTSALIANTLFQIFYGRLSDIYGRKKVIVSALVLLSISDLLCGFSQNAPMLYVFRGLAGVATGGISSMTMTIVSDIVSLEDRGNYQGILGGCVGLGNLIGPFLAAAFVAHSTWRGLFWVVCPLASMCGIACLKVLPNSAPRADFRTSMKKLDYLGVLTGSAAIILTLIPISGGGTYFDWDSTIVITMLVIGGICTVGFVYVEYIVEYKKKALPMMPLSMFRSLPVCVLLLQSVLLGIVYYSQLYYLPLFFENARQLSLYVSAALIVPITSAQALSSIASGQYITYMSKKKGRGGYVEVIWAGFLLWTMGVALTCMFTRNTPIYAIVIILVCQGTGVGLVFQPTLVALQAYTSKENRAVIISNRNFLRSTGGAIGLVISAAMLQNSLKSNLPEGFKHLALSTYSTPDFSHTTEAQKIAVLTAYANASRSVFVLNVPFMAVCLLACLVMKDKGLGRPGEVSLKSEVMEMDNSNAGSLMNAPRERISDKDDVAKDSVEVGSSASTIVT